MRLLNTMYLTGKQLSILYYILQDHNAAIYVPINEYDTLLCGLYTYDYRKNAPIGIKILPVAALNSSITSSTNHIPYTYLELLKYIKKNIV